MAGYATSVSTFAVIIVLCLSSVRCLCPEISEPAFQPCSCRSVGTSSASSGVQLLLLNCDRVVLPTASDPPIIPHFVVAFSQRGAGLQSVGGRPLFVGQDDGNRNENNNNNNNKNVLQMQRLDLSGNRIARVTLGAFHGFHDTLRELNLDGNRLGDHLNPVFTSDELQKLEGLHILHLANNGLRALDDQLLRRMNNLQELHLEGNELASIPSSPLRALANLQELHLEDNAIGVILPGAFASLSSLSLLNLSNNAIGTLQSGAFHGLKGLAFLLLSTNQLRTLNSSALEGMPNLEVLSLSDNLLEEIPTQELVRLPRLRSLLLSANRIHTLNSRTLEGLSSLEFLDISRNNILEISPRAFSSLNLLHELHLDANILRRLADNSLEGLESLEVLAIDDNAILSLPTAALSLLPQLHVLSLDFNRIAAVSATFLKGLSKLHEFSMRYNLIRDVPVDTFENFQNLQVLDLHGNFLEKISSRALTAMRESLVLMDLGDNRIAELDALELPAIETLRLDHNNLTFIPPQHLHNLKKLTVLDLSANHLVTLAADTFQSLEKLNTLLLQENHLSEITPGTIANLDVVLVDLSNNQLRELTEGGFSNLSRLESLNLSANIIQTVKKGAFDNLLSLIDLDLSGNRLSTFKGDFFRGHSALRTLNLKGNLLTYFFPDTFVVHPFLMSLDLSDNKLSFLPPELVRSAHNLAFLDLHSNTLQEIDDDIFSNLPKLHWLDLSHNSIQTIAERALFNSSQLQNINISYNSLEGLPTKLFQGVRRLLLNASHNNLSSLPDEIFERVYVSRVEHINLAHNKFTEIPSKALQKHSFFLEELNMASNLITDIPSSSNVLINVKHLDMSNNPLSSQARTAILSEPKTVRVLNLAGTGIDQVPLLEAPFLRALNLSSNAITQFNENAFQRATHLQQLDISNNQLGSLHPGLVSAWTKLEELQALDLSYNPIRGILGGDFHTLTQLKSLYLNNLTSLARFEAEALQDLNHLQELEMTGYPILHFLDWKSILQSVPGPLRTLSVEIKEAVLSSQLRHAFSARLQRLAITGQNLESVSADAFVGITGQNVHISLSKTQLTTLLPSAFQPLPASTHLLLYVGQNQLTTLAPQFMNFLDERRARIKLNGLENNPVACDCHLRPTQRWVKDRTRRGSLDMAELTCAQPPNLEGRFVLEIPEDQLVCTKPTTTTPIPSTTVVSTTPEDDIQLTMNTEEEPEVVYEAPAPPVAPKEGRITTLNTMDSVIIGVVVGVVAFVCLLIVIICVVKLRHSRPPAHVAPGCPSQCTCMKPNGPPMCQCSPNYPPHPPHGMGTLSVKAMPLTRGGPYPNPPYYVTYPESEHDHR